MTKKRVVIDTNIILVSLSKKSHCYWVFKNFLENNYELVVSNEIMLEYTEIIMNKMGSDIANLFLDIIYKSPNVIKVENYFRFNILSNDYEDNKFIDCYVSGNADFLVTQDNDFNILKEIKFPKVNLLNLSSFKEILLND